MERLQREGRVAHPAVAVVPVALAARRLRQRRGQRRDGGAGGHVREALDRQGRALDRIAEAVVRNARPTEPGAPEGRRRSHPRVRLVHVCGSGELLGPRKRAVRPVSESERVPPPHAVALDAEREVRAQTDRLPGPRRVGCMPVVADEAPLCLGTAVVERRFTDELDLDADPRCTPRSGPACGRRRRRPAAACAA